MKSYYRVFLGAKSAHASECYSGGYIGTDFGIHQDLSQKLPDQWRQFNKVFIPVYLASVRRKKAGFSVCHRLPSRRRTNG